MRFLILADIHGNSEALDAVLERARADGYDEVLVLGDLVGYGAGPNEVVETIRELTPTGKVIRGNHDKVVGDLEDGWNFNSVALAAAQWTRRNLTPENLDYVVSLRPGPVMTETGLVICHGSPRDEDEYLLSVEQATEVFRVHPHVLTFFGHTHIPSLFVDDGDKVSVAVVEGEHAAVPVERGMRYLVNPGSVGQPRDQDRRAAFVIYDGDRDEVHWRRVDYDLERAQKRIRDAGLPPILANRLAVGV